MDKQETMFTIEQLSQFLHKYPIQSVPFIGTFNDYDETNAYLVAFKYYVEHGEDILSEYFRIKDTVRRLVHIQQAYGGFESYMFRGLGSDKTYSEVEYILSYKGPWNLESLLSYFDCTRELLEDFIEGCDNGFQKSYKQNREKNEKEHQGYINKYYESKRVLSKSDLDYYFKNTLKKDMSQKIDKNLIDVSKIKYPIMVFLYNGDKTVSIHKGVHNLEVSMLHYKKKKKFDTYSYAYVSEDIVDDIVAEAIVRFNPSNLYTSAITIKNSIYRTLNQIKQRYKYVNGVDLRIIKKVVDIYEIPIYHLSNGQTIVDKDLFDEALEKYMKG